MKITFIGNQQTFECEVPNRDFTFNKDLKAKCETTETEVEEYRFCRNNLDYRSDIEPRLFRLATVVGDRDFAALLALRLNNVDMFVNYLNQYTYSLYDFVWKLDNVHLPTICMMLMTSPKKDIFVENLSTKFAYTMYYLKQKIEVENSTSPEVREIVTLAKSIIKQRTIDRWRLLWSWSILSDTESEEELFENSDSEESLEYQSEYFELPLFIGYCIINSPGRLDEYEMTNARSNIDIKLYAFEISNDNVICY